MQVRFAIQAGPATAARTFEVDQQKVERILRRYWRMRHAGLSSGAVEPLPAQLLEMLVDDWVDYLLSESRRRHRVELDEQARLANEQTIQDDNQLG